MPLKISLYPNELFDFLKVDPGLDDRAINTMFDAAKLEAEGFLNTDFEQSEAPYVVREWVFNRTAQKYENRGSFNNPNFSPLQPLRVYPFKG